jgi:hypothetical protein
MKKIFFILGFFMIVSVCSAYPSERVSPKVLASFKTEFLTAENVEWETGTNYFRAAFSMNGQRVFAFYSVGGELISIARYISSLQLPINLFGSLKNDYSKYWISDLFELSNGDGVQYYVTLETAETKVTMQSTNGSAWSTYSKSKKI